MESSKTDARGLTKPKTDSVMFMAYETELHKDRPIGGTEHCLSFDLSAFRA